MTIEETYVKQIEDGIRGIRLGKHPKDTNAPIALNKLKNINQGLYDDLLEKYKNVMKEFKKQHPDETN